MAVLPGVLGCRPLRRTVQVRLGTNSLRLPGGTPIFFALAALRSVPQAGSQFRGLATAIEDSLQQAAGNLRNVRYLSHFIVVRSLTPQQATGNALAGAFS